MAGGVHRVLPGHCSQPFLLGLRGTPRWPQSQLPNFCLGADSCLAHQCHSPLPTQAALWFSDSSQHRAFAALFPLPDAPPDLSGAGSCHSGLCTNVTS